MNLSLKARAMTIGIATTVIVVVALLYASSGIYSDTLYTDEIRVLTESFTSYKQDPDLNNLPVPEGQIPLREGKRIVSLIGQSLPERVSIEYTNGTIRIREDSVDPWGSKYIMKVVIEDDILKGFVIASEHIEVKAID